MEVVPSQLYQKTDSFPQLWELQTWDALRSFSNQLSSESFA